MALINMALPRLQVLVAKVGFPDLLLSAASLVTWGVLWPLHRERTDNESLREVLGLNGTPP